MGCDNTVLSCCEGSPDRSCDVEVIFLDCCAVVGLLMILLRTKECCKSCAILERLSSSSTRQLFVEGK